jgi:hypothetical protein
MRRGFIILTTIVVALLSIAVAATLGIRSIEKPLAVNLAVTVSKGKSAEESAAEKKLAEAIETLEALQNTATAIALASIATPTVAETTALSSTPATPTIETPTGLIPQTAPEVSVQTFTDTAGAVKTNLSSDAPGSTQANDGVVPASAPSVLPAPTLVPTLPPIATALPTPKVVNIVVPAFARASAEADCSQDSRGNPVCYPAGNVIDGRMDTAWRESLPASPWIEVELAEPVLVTQIAVVAGYAKIDPYDGRDRWLQNHRPRHVRVYLDEVDQGLHELVDTREWQVINVQLQPARRVRLVIVDSYPPLEGDRSYVAVSEIRVIAP